MNFSRAERLDQLPPYLFADIDDRKRAAIEAGKDVIDFGIGDPDQPTPDFIIHALQQAVLDPVHHCYPPGTGTADFRRAAATWFVRRFGIELDAETEVLGLIGSKEGLAHLPLACLSPGQVALVPSPAYPVYHSATVFAGGRPVDMPLTARNSWLPDLDAIPADLAAAARLMFLNYPNNPTGAIADLGFFERCVDFARRHDIVIVQDAAYSELSFGALPPSALQIEGARDCVVEMYSLSKTFNMTGWRLGFAVGNADVLAALAKIKANVDSGQFGAVQQAGITALASADQVQIRALLDVYRERAEVLVHGLRAIGLDAGIPAATFYVWIAVPAGYDSMSFAAMLLEELAITVVPGVGFGTAGEGYVRFALTVPAERIREAVERMSVLKF